VKIWQDGHALTLGRKNFVAQGGEGSVYVRGDVAYKVYDDPCKALSAAKLTELAAIRHPRVVKPDRLLTDRSGAPVGYSMRHVTGGQPLCRSFARAYRERVGLTPQAMFDLVLDLAGAVTAVHSAGVLIVDLNELNILLGPDLDAVWMIDVDSFQTAHFPATAIMDSVRDRHHASFSEKTDWFSFAIVSFQMLVGIHPYKGKHPTIGGLDARMRKNVSVFDQTVRTPPSAWPLAVIPAPWAAWYEAVFQDGERRPPPLAAGATVVITAPTATAVPGDRLTVTVQATFEAVIRSVFEFHGRVVVVTDDEVVVDGRPVGLAPPGRHRIGFTPRSGRPLLASVRDRRLRLRDMLAGRDLEIDVRADSLMAYDGRIYVKCRDRILEIVTLETGGRLVASTRTAASVLEHATQLFDGVAVQSLLGDTWVTVFPAAGVSRPVRLPELDRCTVIDARFERGVLVVIGARDGRYHRIVIRFDRTYQRHDVRTTEGIAMATANLLVLDHGVAMIPTDGDTLELFTARPGSQQVKEVTGTGLGDARLVNLNGQAAFHRGRELSSMTLRSGR